jgi:glycosyltransferase involved in cell wall biosynthesis
VPDMSLSLLHVSPTYYSKSSVVGGGEKYILYMSSAIGAAAALQGIQIHDSILAFGQEPGVYEIKPGARCEVMRGRPWEPLSVNLQDFNQRIAEAEIIVVHQCLSAFGLFVASHSRLAGKVVIGVDEGGGEHALVHHTPEIGLIFDWFHAYSRFCANSFRDIEGRVAIVPGPVDTSYYRPDPTVKRDASLVLAVGRLLPHKGFERIINALPAGLRLIIAGTKYDREYCNYLSKLFGFSRVKIEEHLTDAELLLLMQTAGIFVHASTHIDYRGTYYAKPELLGLAPLEALSAGTPALVSSAGSLPELTCVGGCRMFRDDIELAELLAEHCKGSACYPSASEIHQNVESEYGLETFGRRFLDTLLGGDAAA